MALELRYAVANLVTDYQGQRVVLSVDEAWHASDPFVKANPDLFTDQPKRIMGIAAPDRPKRGRPPVEAASDVPGEQRNVRRAKA